MDLTVIGGALRDGSDDERMETLHGLEEPLDRRIVEAVIVAAERGGEDVRERAVWKIARSTWKDPGILDRDRVERMVAVARRERHPELLRALLGARPLPASGAVLAASFDLPDWPPLMRDAVVRCAVDGEVEPAAALALLDRNFSGEEGRIAMRVAEAVYDETGDREVQRRILRVLLSPGSAEERSDACWALKRAEKEGPAAASALRLTPESITAVFGTPRVGLLALHSLLDDPIALKQVGIFEWLADLLRYRFDKAVVAMFEQEPEAYRQFLGGLIAIAAGDYWPILRTAALSFLEQGTPVDERDRVVSALAGFGPEGDLRYWTERVINALEGREPTEETFLGEWEDGSGRRLTVEWTDDGLAVSLLGPDGAPFSRKLADGSAATTLAMPASTDGRRLRVQVGKPSFGPSYELIPVASDLLSQVYEGRFDERAPAIDWAAPLLRWKRVTSRA